MTLLLSNLDYHNIDLSRSVDPAQAGVFHAGFKAVGMMGTLEKARRTGEKK